MGLFDIFKRKSSDTGVTSDDIFKEQKEEDVKLLDCGNCEVLNICKVEVQKEEKYLCQFIKIIDDYDPEKPSILIFDDNMGVVSFLEDDLIEVDEENKINLSEYNILKFSSQYAGFQLQAALKTYNGLNIQYGIFDLTLGGGVYDEKKGNIVLDGVDAFISVQKMNPNLKYIFFTGNKLNPYIKKNKEIIEKFKAFNGSDISDHVLYKTSLSPEDRKNYIADFLTKD